MWYHTAAVYQAPSFPVTVLSLHKVCLERGSGTGLWRRLEINLRKQKWPTNCDEDVETTAAVYEYVCYWMCRAAAGSVCSSLVMRSGNVCTSM